MSRAVSGSSQARAAPADPAAGDPGGAGLPLSATRRTRHRRLRHLGRIDRQWLYAVLRAGLVAHLGVITDGWPMVIPTVYGFDTGTLYLHGSVASQSLDIAGAEVCVTITLTDGLVLARAHIRSRAGTRADRSPAGQLTALPGGQSEQQRAWAPNAPASPPIIRRTP